MYVYVYIYIYVYVYIYMYMYIYIMMVPRKNKKKKKIKKIIKIVLFHFVFDSPGEVAPHFRVSCLALTVSAWEAYKDDTCIIYDILYVCDMVI